MPVFVIEETEQVYLKVRRKNSRTRQGAFQSCDSCHLACLRFLSCELCAVRLPVNNAVAR